MEKLANGGNQICNVSGNVSNIGTSNKSFIKNEMTKIILENEFQIEAFLSGKFEVVIESWMINNIQLKNEDSIKTFKKSFMNILDVYNIEHSSKYTKNILADIRNNKLKPYYDVNCRMGFLVKLYIKILSEIDKSLIITL